MREFAEKPFKYSYMEIGGNLFDFLFASQDASTSSLLWAITFLDSHPEVLQKVRKEVAQYWLAESGAATITGENLREMKYTEAVAREVVRIRAPATMVPHIAGVDFPLTENYVIPKGTIVFPSVFDSSFQGFTEAERFDPDRFMERQEDRVYKKNFLAFGAGSHQCVGQRYAINHLMLFIAMFSTLINFKRDRSDGCDEIAYVPTIVPKDDCRVSLSRRIPSLW